VKSGARRIEENLGFLGSDTKKINEELHFLDTKTSLHLSDFDDIPIVQPIEMVSPVKERLFPVAGSEEFRVVRLEMGKAIFEEQEPIEYECGDNPYKRREMM
jgi:hypothetical protein